MSARQRMTMRALLERNQQTLLNPDKGPGQPVWGVQVESLPCFFYVATGREIVGEKSVVIESPRMLAPIGADILESDRINGIKTKRGAVYASGLFNIRSVTPVHDHLELALEAVR